MLKKLSILLVGILTFNNIFAYEPPINLHLPKVGSEDRGALGMALLVSGAALVAGTILEGDASYTTAYYNVNGKLVRDTKVFFEQTPRQIFFLTGMTIGITGLYISIDEIKFRKRR